MQSTTDTVTTSSISTITVGHKSPHKAKKMNNALSAFGDSLLKTEEVHFPKGEWLQKNTDALEACNRLTDKHGLFSDSYRVF